VDLRFLQGESELRRKQTFTNKHFCCRY